MVEHSFRICTIIRSILEALKRNGQLRLRPQLQLQCYSAGKHDHSRVPGELFLQVISQLLDDLDAFLPRGIDTDTGAWWPGTPTWWSPPAPPLPPSSPRAYSASSGISAKQSERKTAANQSHLMKAK